MKFSYNGLKSVIKIAQMAFGLTLLFFSFNHGLVQKVYYTWFEINQADYRVIDATIIDRKTYRLLEGREKEILEIICVKISYTIADHDFEKWVYYYPDMVGKEKIKIGVHVRNPKKIIRSEPYKISIYEVKVYCLLFFGIVLLMMINNVCYKICIGVGKNGILNDVPKEKIEKEQLGKQEIILSRMQVCFCQEQELQQKIVYFKNKGILFNEGTLWILKKYGNAEEMRAILNMSPLTDQEKYFDFLLSMYEQGFPEKYYVLAKYNENYYCCCKESEQLYMYSRGLGITHTKYATIYDYIIEQINKG